MPVAVAIRVVGRQPGEILCDVCAYLAAKVITVLRRARHDRCAIHTTSFVHGLDGQLVAESPGGGTAREYVYLAGELLAVMDAPPVAAIHYVHHNHLHTPIGMTNEAGVIVWRAYYDPFGNALLYEDADYNGTRITLNPRFPGQYYDQETGLHYNWHRYYDPKTGRYLSSDPIGLDGGLNTYAYVENNPLRYTDPEGLLGRAPGRGPYPPGQGPGASPADIYNNLGGNCMASCRLKEFLICTTFGLGGGLTGSSAGGIIGGPGGLAVGGRIGYTGTYYGCQAVLNLDCEKKCDPCGK